MELSRYFDQRYLRFGKQELLLYQKNISCPVKITMARQINIFNFRNEMDTIFLA
jgi:hypothetical protein